MNDLSLLLRKSSTLPTQVPEFYYLRRKSWGKPGNEAKQVKVRSQPINIAQAKSNWPTHFYLEIFEGVSIWTSPETGLRVKPNHFDLHMRVQVDAACYTWRDLRYHYKKK